MGENVLHQIFIEMGHGELKDIPDFNWSHTKTKLFCSENNIKNILWSKSDIEDLLEDYPQYKDFYQDLRYDIQRVDFARLLILYHHGGVYHDLDVRPFAGVDLSYLFEEEIFFARWFDSNLPYNAICGAKKGNPLLLEIIEHCIESYEIKSKMEIYKTWKARFVFQTTGHFMIHRVIKNKINYLPIVSVYNSIKNISVPVPDDKALFWDLSASVWFQK